jgi:hypothetical protein
MARRRIYRRQPPLKGGRDPLFSCVHPATRAAAVRVAQQHGVSPSWVVATILAEAFDIEEHISYKTLRRKGEMKNG